MNRKKAKQLPAAIEKVRTAFDAWRAQKRGRERIPEALWRSATRAAQHHGVHQVSRTLGLDYSRLKQRVEEAAGVPTAVELVEGGFVEMVNRPGAAGAACVVELEKGSGTRMRICLRDAGSLDWGRLKEAFLGA